MPVADARGRMARKIARARNQGLKSQAIRRRNVAMVKRVGNVGVAPKGYDPRSRRWLFRTKHPNPPRRGPTRSGGPRIGSWS